ncbi:MAG: hypothetical protein JW395_0176 [Nitrospira sp.]|nr:hypothetical protein [Nitrospira sp.]
MSVEEHLRDLIKRYLVRDLIERYPPDLRDPRDWSQTVKNIHAEATYRATMDAVQDYGQRLHVPRPRRLTHATRVLA